MQRSLRHLLLIAATIFVFSLSGCDGLQTQYAFASGAGITGGDPGAGRDRILRYGCHSCHTIPGVPGANALVGPPLLHWSKRVYIAGELPNTPENLMRWIQHPTLVEPKTAMPEMGVTEKDSRDIAAYLYSLR